MVRKKTISVQGISKIAYCQCDIGHLCCISNDENFPVLKTKLWNVIFVWNKWKIDLTGVHVPLRGTPSEDAGSPEDRENVQVFSFACIVWFYQYLCNRSTFHFEPELLRVQPCWFALCQGKIRKMLVYGIMDTSTTHTGFVMVSYVADTGCQTHNGSAHVFVFTTSSHQFF